MKSLSREFLRDDIFNFCKVSKDNYQVNFILEKLKTNRKLDIISLFNLARNLSVGIKDLVKS